MRAGALKPDKVADWYQTFLGYKFNPLFAKPGDVFIEDIAHALSQICRFGGHSKEFYSVAQHSVLCARHAPDHCKFQALMHDAQEAYIGDMVVPLKNQIPAFRKVENYVWPVVARRYRIEPKLDPAVKVVDREALATERRDLLNNRFNYRWKILAGIKPWPEKVNPWPCKRAEQVFLRWFNYLYPQHLCEVMRNESRRRN